MLQESDDKSFQEEENKSDSRNFDGRYKTLFEQVNAAAFMTTLDGKITEANQKSCELLGYNWDELIQLSLQDILPASADWSQLIEEISARGGINFETENIRKDGTHVPVEISTSLFKMEGKPVMLALIQDITERKKAENRLIESKEYTESLFTTTPSAIFTIDINRKIKSWNKRAEEITGYSAKEMER